jgi:hypothetical protein
MPPISGHVFRYAIAQALNADPSDMQRTLTRMDAAGLIDRDVGSARRRATRSSPAGQWRVAVDHEERLRAGVAALERLESDAQTGLEPPERHPAEMLGTLVERQALVVVKVNTATLPDLLTLLATGEITVGTSWIARLEGDGHQFVFAFEPGSDPTAPDRLVTRLARAGFRCSTALYAMSLNRCQPR